MASSTTASMSVWVFEDLVSMPICYLFSGAGMKHHDQGSFKMSKFIWTYSAREWEYILTEKLSNKYRTWQQEAESSHLQPWVGSREIWHGVRLSVSKPDPSEVLQQGWSQKPPQTAPPTGDQVFKCLRLWGTFHIQINTTDFISFGCTPLRALAKSRDGDGSVSRFFCFCFFWGFLYYLRIRHHTFYSD